eukprot:CAMPEP_0204488970 /NCGR_PEP_ID=MMETSP0471-20130131/71054_1 /ASSEMBLY_ACC=CAM_ASM_000602 /TAXON_ID=2969 /ORGANISM="Oxyrrhis marina" /LENGTH=110 /DNA_ID=CAMNT_0051492789 /DNA_START=539 /DNA_END=871 /DNA_ORIENTATION=+
MSTAGFKDLPESCTTSTDNTCVSPVSTSISATAQQPTYTWYPKLPWVLECSPVADMSTPAATAAATTSFHVPLPLYGPRASAILSQASITACTTASEVPLPHVGEIMVHE